jgi:anti-sigma-K factor RskA
MNVQEYIESGILELYLAGTLSEKENAEVYEMLQKHPELLDEIRKIEHTVTSLTASVAPKSGAPNFKDLLIKMIQDREEGSNVIPLQRPKNNWIRYSGWAAAIVVGSALVLTAVMNSDLDQQLNTAKEEQQKIEQRLDSTQTYLDQKETLLAAIRGKDVITVPLQGQAVSPSSYAKVYWNQADNKIYVDVQGLPDPPAGKVYQLWSLQLNPLTPTSLGTLDSFLADNNKIFEIDNPNDSQAFGITLEPAGGSESPTLEQLYTLGAVSS